MKIILPTRKGSIRPRPSGQPIRHAHYQKRQLDEMSIGRTVRKPWRDGPASTQWREPAQHLINDITISTMPERSLGASTRTITFEHKFGVWRGLGGFLGKKQSSKSSSQASQFAELGHLECSYRASSHDSEFWSGSQNAFGGGDQARSGRQLKSACGNTQAVVPKPQASPVKRPLRRKLSKARQGARLKYGERDLKNFSSNKYNSAAFSEPKSSSPRGLSVSGSSDKFDIPSPTKKTLLDIEIPSVELERYSIMFGNLLSQPRPASPSIRFYPNFAAPTSQDHLSHTMRTSPSAMMGLQSPGNSSYLKQYRDQAVDLSNAEGCCGGKCNDTSQFAFILHGPSHESQTSSRLDTSQLNNCGKPSRRDCSLHQTSSTSTKRRFKTDSASVSEQLPTRQSVVSDTPMLSANDAFSSSIVTPLDATSLSCPENVKKAAEMSIARQISVSQRQKARLDEVMPSKITRIRTTEST